MRVVAVALAAVVVLSVSAQAASVRAQGSDQLEPELRAWLETHGPLRVGWSAELRPVSIVEDGVVTGGYAVDAWDLAALRLGIDVEHLGYPDAASLGVALDTGEIDVVGGLGFNPAVADGRQASEPYAWVPGVFVGRPEQAVLGVADLTGRTLTMLPAAAIRDDVMQEHPGATYVSTDGPVEGLRAVAAGEIDLFFGPLALLGHQITRLDLDLVPIGEHRGLNTVQSWADTGSRAAEVADAVRGSLSRSDLAIFHVLWTGFDLTEPRDEPAPSWVTPVGLALLGAVLILTLFALVLRRKVTRATVELRSTNERLEDLVAARTSALVASNDALNRLVRVDELTGLATRRAVLERLENELQRDDRNNSGVAVVLADVDRFKDVNDRHGHAEGDRVLREIAVAVADNVRQIDVVGRFGGEELLVVLPGANEAQALSVADRVRESVSHVATPDGEITLSAGVATRHRGEPAEQLIARADQALYRAKRAGRNNVQGTDRTPQS